MSQGQVLNVQSKLAGGRSRGGYTFSDGEPGTLVRVGDVGADGKFHGNAAPVATDGKPAGDGVINDGRHRISTVVVKDDDGEIAYRLVEMNQADFLAVKNDPYLLKAKSIPATAIAPPAAAAAAPAAAKAVAAAAAGATSPTGGAQS